MTENELFEVNDIALLKSLAANQQKVDHQKQTNFKGNFQM